MNWTSATHEQIVALQNQLIMIAEWAAKSNATPDARDQMLEPYREMLDMLYERDMPLARLADNSDFLIHVKGPAVHAPQPRVSLVAKLLTSARDQLGGLARQISGTTSLRLPQALDMNLVGFAHGSLFIGLSTETTPGSQATRDAARMIGEVGARVTEDANIASFTGISNDPAVRDTAVAAIRQMAPSGQMGIKEIDLYGKSIPKVVALTTDTRRNARRLLAERPVAPQPTRATFVGTVRSIDLDALRFEIRNVEGYAESIRCAHELDEEEVKALVNHRVRVVGTAEHGPRGDVRLLWVDEVERVES